MFCIIRVSPTIFHPDMYINQQDAQGGFGWSRVTVLAFRTTSSVVSNPSEAVGFFRAKNYSARLPSEGK
jgi:hypothetical protein